MKAGMLTHEDVSLACGWCFALMIPSYMHSAALTTANECGWFSTALQVYRRVEPSPLPEEWWSGTCDVVDVTSARLLNLWLGVFSMAKRLPSATQSSWWSELLVHAIRMSKLNASAGLSGRDTMAAVTFTQPLSVVEVAAQDELQHEMLLASGVADALEYAILHDFTYGGGSVAANASGAAVALVGRNEGGKVLPCVVRSAFVVVRMLLLLSLLALLHRLVKSACMSTLSLSITMTTMHHHRQQMAMRLCALS